jgi:hypothetical protein
MNQSYHSQFAAKTTLSHMTTNLLRRQAFEFSVLVKLSLTAPLLRFDKKETPIHRRAHLFHLAEKTKDREPPLADWFIWPLPSELQFNVASLIISSFGTSSHYSLGKLAAHAFRY